MALASSSTLNRLELGDPEQAGAHRYKRIVSRPNVLIEIGAAMALYGDRFALLVEEGVDLPSNLQGLYECRYSGDELNMPANDEVAEGNERVLTPSRVRRENGPVW